MSRRTYILGFCKAAADNGVDPMKLADTVTAMSKKAGDGPGFWDRVGNLIGDAKAWWENPDNAALRPLIGAGVGSALGTGLGAALVGKKGLRAGAILGALGGGAASVDWKALSDSLGVMAEQSRARASARADLSRRPLFNKYPTAEGGIPWPNRERPDGELIDSVLRNPLAQRTDIA